MVRLENEGAALAQEHGVLLRHYGELQRRCTAYVQEIEHLQAQAMRLRARAIACDSALAWKHEARHALPDAESHMQWFERQLERSLRSADLVICQTGCISHGGFWRVADHCKRTGKTCVLVEDPDALRSSRG